MDETNYQVPSSSSSAKEEKKASRSSIRLPAKFAKHFFELTKTLGFKRDSMTVDWLIQQSQWDPQADELLLSAPQDRITMMTPPRKRHERGRITSDRHRRSEDGRDRRVRVPENCVPRLIYLTQTLALKSEGQTIEWLFRKYWLSRISPEQATHESTTAPNSTSALTRTGTGEHENYSEINVYGTGIPLKSENDVQQLFYKASGGNDLGEGSIIPQDHQLHIEEMQVPADNINSNSDPITMNLPYLQQQLCFGDVGGYGLVEKPIFTQGLRNMRGGSHHENTNSYSYQNPNLGPVYALGEGPIIPQDYRYTGEMLQPAHNINNNSDAILLNSPYLQQQMRYQGVAGYALGEGPVNTQDLRNQQMCHQGVGGYALGEGPVNTQDLRNQQLCHQSMGGYAQTVKGRSHCCGWSTFS